MDDLLDFAEFPGRALSSLFGPGEDEEFGTDFDSESDDEKDFDDDSETDVDMRMARHTLWQQYFAWANVADATELCCIAEVEKAEIPAVRSPDPATR